MNNTTLKGDAQISPLIAMPCNTQLDIAYNLSHPKWIPLKFKDANQVRRSKFRDCHLRLYYKMPQPIALTVGREIPCKFVEITRRVVIYAQHRID